MPSIRPKRLKTNENGMAVIGRRTELDESGMLTAKARRLGAAKKVIGGAFVAWSRLPYLLNPLPIDGGPNRRNRS